MSATNSMTTASLFRQRTRCSRLLGCLALALPLTQGDAAEPDPVRTASDTFSTPLITAIRTLDSSAIQQLMQQDVDVNEPQRDGATPLHWAVHRDDIKTARRLIQAGANVVAKNDFGVMPLSLACVNGNAAMIKLLIEAGADPNDGLRTGETPLMTASRTGDVESVRELIARGAEVNATEPERAQTALMWALDRSHRDVAELLLDSGADINAATKLGSTPLMFAVRRGNLEATKTLLDRGANLNAKITVKWGRQFAPKTKHKLTALHVATQRGHVDVALELLARGADANGQSPGYTALHWAAGTWNTELTKPNSITWPKDHEWAHMAGIQDRKMELVRALIEAGTDVNAKVTKPPERFGYSTWRSPTGATAYVLAAHAGEYEIMQLLYEKGADPTITSDNGRNAVLMAAGTDRRVSEFETSAEVLFKCLKLAVEHGADVHQVDSAGNNALHGAAWLRSIEMVDFLYQRGVDINLKNSRGYNPLYIADHNGLLAGLGQNTVRFPVGTRITELIVPTVVKELVEKWEDLPPHVRKAVRSLLQGELEALGGTEAKETS